MSVFSPGRLLFLPDGIIIYFYRLINVINRFCSHAEPGAKEERWEK